MQPQSFPDSREPDRMATDDIRFQFWISGIMLCTVYACKTLLASASLSGSGPRGRLPWQEFFPSDIFRAALSSPCIRRFLSGPPTDLVVANLPYFWEIWRSMNLHIGADCWTGAVRVYAAAKANKTGALFGALSGRR